MTIDQLIRYLNAFANLAMFGLMLFIFLSWRREVRKAQLSEAEMAELATLRDAKFEREIQEKKTRSTLNPGLAVTGYPRTTETWRSNAQLEEEYKNAKRAKFEAVYGLGLTGLDGPRDSEGRESGGAGAQSGGDDSPSRGLHAKHDDTLPGNG